jgi:membrane protein YdbS with pleckstrin-like domain
MEQASVDLLDGTVNRLDPRIAVVWTLSASIGWILLAAVFAIVLAVANASISFIALALIGGVLVAGVSALWARAAWARWRWSAWPDALDLRHGVLVVRESLVPYHRIQQIDIERNVIERMLGLSTLVLRTASASSDGKIPGIREEIADSLRVRLLTRAGVDDAV